MAIAVTTIPARTLSFQVVFTGAETYDTDEPNVHGGAMWARMPLTALVGDTPFDEWPEPMPAWAAQPGTAHRGLTRVCAGSMPTLPLACEDRWEVLPGEVLFHRGLHRFRDRG